MAHLDVVPVEGEWQHGAFSGDIVDGIIWGRGTLDDKGALVAVCEAVEVLLERGHVPAQDVWLSFGCDEEVFGQAAPMAVEELRSPRRTAVDRGRRGRRDRRRRVPGDQQADRRHRGDREGRHVARAGRRGPRRARVHAVEARPDRTTGPGDHPARQRADAGERPRADARAVPPPGAARAARDAPAARRADRASSPCSPARSCSPDPRPPRWRGRRSRSRRSPAPPPST